VGGVQIQPPSGVWLGGNPTLTPEKTDTYSAGIVWSPRFVPGFTLTMDWYQLFTRDVILNGNYFWPLAATQNLISGGTAFVDPDGCGGGSGAPGFPGGPGVGVTRDTQGNLECIDSLNSNAGKRLVQGIEVAAEYVIPTERFGKFTISGNYNHFFTWKAEPLPGTGAHGFLGTYNNGSLAFGPGAVPYNKGFLRGEWEWRGFDFVATGNYIGDFEDDPTFIAGNQQIGGTDTNPSFARHRQVTSYITLDMQLSYQRKFRRSGNACSGELNSRWA
jgi:outer membrane receptor protein involved in Fe transport